MGFTLDGDMLSNEIEVLARAAEIGWLECEDPETARQPAQQEPSSGRM
jgi:hypothetical protein